MLPERSFGMRSVSMLTQVARLRSKCVAAVRSDAAQPVGLGVHHGVHDLIGEPAQQLLHVDGAVFEPGHGEHVRRQAW